jgi:hypothetical protein
MSAWRQVVPVRTERVSTNKILHVDTVSTDKLKLLFLLIQHGPAITITILFKCESLVNVMAGPC